MRDLPDAVHAQLQRRAKSQRQSLQQYLVAELKRLAERPTIDEVSIESSDAAVAGSDSTRQWPN